MGSCSVCSSKPSKSLAKPIENSRKNKAQDAQEENKESQNGITQNTTGRPIINHSDHPLASYTFPRTLISNPKD